VVTRLREAGCDVRVLSREGHESADGIECVTGDLLENNGIEAAVSGVSAIVHCASTKKGDVDATRDLVRAAKTLPQAPYLVFVSIVGVDRIDAGYARSKLDTERVVSESGLPWTTLRVTHFYDFLLSGQRRW